MKSRRLISLAFALAALPALPALIAGCDDKKSSGPAPVVSAAPSATVSAAPSSLADMGSAAASAMGSGSTPPAPMSLHFRAGPAALFLDEAQGLELDEAHKAIVEKLADQLDADEDDAPRGEIKELHDDIVAAVRAGAVDDKKLTPRVVALQRSMQTRLDKEVVAMNALFTALTPENRKALGAAAQKKAREREQDFVRAAGDAGSEAITERAKGRPDRLKRELDLDAAQAAKLDPILAKLPPESDGRADARKRFDTLVAAFDSPKFDAKKLDAFGPPAAKARVPMDREVLFLAQLVSILTPEQREALAGRLEGERLRLGTGSPSGRIKDWPFPFEIEPGDVVSGLAGTKPRGKGPKRPPGMPSGAPAPSAMPGGATHH